MARLLRGIARFACYRALGLVAFLRRLGAPRRPSVVPSRPTGEPRSVLLSEISLLGDVVSFTASLHAARLFWPRARIDVLVPRELAPLVLGNPHIDGVLPLRDMGLVAYAKAILGARRRRYDMILSMSPGLRNAGAAVLGGAGAAAGFLVDRGFPPHFLNAQRVESIGVALAEHVRIDRRTHIADRGAAVLRALGAAALEEAGEARPVLPVDEAASERVGLFLSAAGMPDRSFAVLHPSARERRRRWPLRRFVELARALADDQGLAVVWTGGQSDAGLVSRARSLLGRPSAAFVGRPVAELAALLDQAALFVGNDSGPMHVAGAVGTPLVGIFGPGDPARLLPRNADATALGGPEVRGGLAVVSVEDVVRAARRVVARGRPRGAGALLRQGHERRPSFVAPKERSRTGEEAGGLMDLSVVIVAGDEIGLLKESLPAAASACEGTRHELIVVDNASADGTSEWVASGHPAARLLRCDRRLGLSAARNLGIAGSSGEFLLFLDADADLDPRGAKELIGFMRSNGSAGLAGPRLLYPDGRFQESCRTFQTWSAFLRRGLGLGLSGRDGGVLRRAREAERPFQVDWVMGACQIVRRRAIDEAGTMDERFRLYYGDVEWCRRMKSAGWKVCYVPAAVCVHRYQRRSAGFPPGRWTLVHLRDFVRFRRKAGRPAPPRSRRAPHRAAPKAREGDGHRPARILYLFDLLGLSGPPLQYAMLLWHLDRERFEPVACATLVRSPGDEDLAREMGLPLCCFGKRGPFDKYVGIPLALRRMIRSLRIDLVHGELFKVNLLAAFVGPGTRAATVISQSISYDQNPAYSRWDMLCYRKALRRADRVIVNADALRRSAVGRHGGPPERIRTVHYSLDLDALDGRGRLARGDLGIPAGARVIVTVARLVPEKGHSVLLRTLKLLRPGPAPVAVLFVGDGPERDSLEREVRESGLGDSVKLLGARRDVPDILALSDLFVLPSFYEGMPAAVMEAMALGVPVVATAVDGTAELVEDGVTGRLVRPGDEEGLAAVVSEMLADRDMARRMAGVARKEVRGRFTVDRMVRATEAVYEEALRRKRRSRA